MVSLGAFTELLDALHKSPSDGERARRRSVGQALLRIFDAEVFVSCRSDESGKFVSPVWIGMSDSNMLNYEKHFQFHDPLTPKMRELGRAATVREGMNPTDLRRTDFYNDFLRLDGLREGMNYFPSSTHPGTLDLRIWRVGESTEFSCDQVRLLQSSGELLQSFLPAEEHTIAPSALDGQSLPPDLSLLTPREHSVAWAVARGLSDREACKELGCSLGTLRTHLAKVFAKLALRSRGELIASLAPYQSAEVNSVKLPMV